MRIWRTHEGRGSDLDNVIKICDALNGVVWGDDRYMRGIGAAFQDPDAKNPRIEIVIRRFRKGTA
jgi:Holliday junction resolvase RusA-like endonuclease